MFPSIFPNDANFWNRVLETVDSPYRVTNGERVDSEMVTILADAVLKLRLPTTEEEVKESLIYQDGTPPSR